MHQPFKPVLAHSMLGHHGHASEMPLKLRFAGRPMLAGL